MAYTAQMRVLDQVQKLFGKTGFTEDHITYRRVGFRDARVTLSAIGDTWEEATNNLQAKVGAV